MANSMLDRLRFNGAGIGAGLLGAMAFGGIAGDVASGKINQGFTDQASKDTGLILPSNNASGLGNASSIEGVNNALTGNLDFQRDLEMLQREQSFNASEAAKQREFEEYMSSTAYSRMAEDLKKAGYNPALLLGSGGASTPTAYSASSHGYSHAVNNSVVNTLVGGILSLALNSARSNNALSAARLIDEQAELVRETKNADSRTAHLQNVKAMFDQVYKRLKS